jgi:quercetin dioxygenase-like cupin family protein
MKRRKILTSLTAVLAVRHLEAQAPRRGPVFQHDLPNLTLHDWAVTSVEVSYAPGGSSTAHRHPGLTFAYVLEGEIVSKVGDEPEKTYATGEMWMETPEQLHAVSRNASSTKTSEASRDPAGGERQAANDTRLITARCRDRIFATGICIIDRTEHFDESHCSMFTDGKPA